MAEVVLSRTAYADLAEIGEYGEERFGRAAADSYQDEIDRSFERLAEYPQCGEAKPDWGKGFRCLVCHRHRIVYRIMGDTVQIFRILHHSRDASRYLPE